MIIQLNFISQKGDGGGGDDDDVDREVGGRGGAFFIRWNCIFVVRRVIDVNDQSGKNERRFIILTASATN